jgi:predicted PhzF superfamily epimerase YddE/YHI9
VARLHLLRVFCGESGGGGNPLAVFVEGRDVPPSERQDVAAELGLSETVFVDDAAEGAIRIFTPAAELPFAGHPTVGTAWLLAREAEPVRALNPPAGEVSVRYAGEETFVTARPAWGPQFRLAQLGSAAEVDAHARPRAGLSGVWAYEDEEAGRVRARVFPVAIGIDEDEATGAAAVQLCSLLGRELEIRQGRGSRILARPAAGGAAEIGGRCVLDEVRDRKP